MKKILSALIIIMSFPLSAEVTEYPDVTKAANYIGELIGYSEVCNISISQPAIVEYAKKIDPKDTSFSGLMMMTFNAVQRKIPNQTYLQLSIICAVLIQSAESDNLLQIDKNDLLENATQEE